MHVSVSGRVVPCFVRRPRQRNGPKADCTLSYVPAFPGQSCPQARSRVEQVRITPAIGADAPVVMVASSLLSEATLTRRSEC
jgi:hypothetical protein